jgi:hypothetical protein
MLGWPLETEVEAALGEWMGGTLLAKEGWGSDPGSDDAKAQAMKTAQECQKKGQGKGLKAKVRLEVLEGKQARAKEVGTRRLSRLARDEHPP